MIDESRRARLRAYSRIGWGLTAMLVAIYAVQLPIILAVKRLSPDFLQTEAFFWGITAVSQYCIAMPLFWLITRSLPEAQPEPLYNASLSQMAGLIVMMVGFSGWGGIFANLLNMALSALRGAPIPNPSAGIADHNVLAVFLFVCIIGPVMEEWVFRGILVRKLRPYGDGVCLLFSTALFALLHCNTYQTIGVAFGALLLGYVRIRTGSLMHAIALHVTWNTVAVLMQHGLDYPAFMVICGLGLIVALVTSAVLAVFTVMSELRRPAAERFRFAGTLRAVCTPGILAYCLMCFGMIVFTAFFAG